MLDFTDDYWVPKKYRQDRSGDQSSRYRWLQSIKQSQDQVYSWYDDREDLKDKYSKFSGYLMTNRSLVFDDLYKSKFLDKDGYELDFNYSVQLIEWKDYEQVLRFNFTDPLMISKGLKKDKL